MPHDEERPRIRIAVGWVAVGIEGHGVTAVGKGERRIITAGESERAFVHEIGWLDTLAGHWL
ncbi:MAG: hypothetical protein JXA50_11080 [Deltaproteobacteria bacterium]|nr:hypothetical protein [Deltaproteobacteria bacterium]